MASNKQVDQKQTLNFVISKCYPDAAKDKGKKTDFKKLCRNFKVVDRHLTYKRKRKVIFDNNRNRTN